MVFQRHSLMGQQKVDRQDYSFEVFFCAFRFDVIKTAKRLRRC